jgi:N-acetyl-gamma-glutamyl-phosphate reductase
MNLAIYGATGYTGLELIKLLINHPHFQISHIYSDTMAGKELSTVSPFFKKLCPLTLEATNIYNSFNDIDAVFLCLPHGESFGIVKELISNSKIVIDLSADFRFSNPQLYEKTYKVEHMLPDILKRRAYGIPEIFKDEILKTNIIANPGCYPTSIIMPLYPLIYNNLIDSNNIIADSKSGVSGAGKKSTSTTHFCEVNEDFKAYSVFIHRHSPEINNILSTCVNQDIHVIFTPHLLPITRGIESTIYTKSDISLDALFGKVAEYYKKSYFVRVYKEEYVAIKNVAHTNFIDISLFKDGKDIIILSTIDNLVKGASGQAIQNLNIKAGYEEDCGLL